MGSFLVRCGAGSPAWASETRPPYVACVRGAGRRRLVSPACGVPWRQRGFNVTVGPERLPWSCRKRREHPGTPSRGYPGPLGLRSRTRRSGGRAAQPRRRLPWTRRRTGLVRTACGNCQWSRLSGGPSAAAAGDRRAGAGTEAGGRLGGGCVSRWLPRPLPGRRQLRFQAGGALVLASPRLGWQGPLVDLGITVKYLSQLFRKKPFLQVQDYLALLLPARH